MQFTQTHKITLGVVALALLIGAYIIFDKKSDTAKNLPNDVISTDNPGGSRVVVNPDGTSYTIEEVPLEEGRGLPQPIPDLNRPITVFPGVTVTQEARAFASIKVSETQTKLKQDLIDLSSWIYLGSYQKQGGDYEGATLSWKYASRLAPTDFVSLGNLGNLYAYFIKDRDQAETYYKQAIVNGPTQSYLYVQLAEVYRDVFQSKSRALSTVNQGLAKIPNDPSLLRLKSTLE